MASKRRTMRDNPNCIAVRIQASILVIKKRGESEEQAQFRGKLDVVNKMNEAFGEGNTRISIDGF